MPSGFLMIRLVVAGPLAASKVASNRFVASLPRVRNRAVQRLWCSIMRLLTSNRVRGEF